MRVAVPAVRVLDKLNVLLIEADGDVELLPEIDNDDERDSS